MDYNGLKRVLTLMAKSAFDTIWPRTCRCCGQSLTVGEELLCTGCMMDLPRTGLHDSYFNDIHHRIGPSAALDVAAGWFYYYSGSPYSRLIHEAKYGDRPMTAKILGRMYGRELVRAGFKGRFDVLVPVPLHRLKFLRRGYNQSREIADGMAMELGCGLADCIIAQKGHDTQTRRGAYERAENVKDTFIVRDGEAIRGKRVAVVDDVITTGATVRACVEAIRQCAAPASVSVLAIGVAKMR